MSGAGAGSAPDVRNGLLNALARLHQFAEIAAVWPHPPAGTTGTTGKTEPIALSLTDHAFYSAARDEVLVLSTALYRVLELHPARLSNLRETPQRRCSHDGHFYPCPTVMEIATTLATRSQGTS